MINREKIQQMKERLIELATKIRKDKPYSWFASHEARHLHMIYGVVRGVPMDRIEAKCRTLLCEHELGKINKNYELEVDCVKVICHSRSVLI